LVSYCGAYFDIIADEIDAVAADMLHVSDRAILAEKADFFLSLEPIFTLATMNDKHLNTSFWRSRVDGLIQTHAAAVILAAQTNGYVRTSALYSNLITVKQALEMSDGLAILFGRQMSFFPATAKIPYLNVVYQRLLMRWPAFADSSTIAELEAVGEYLCDHPELPWLNGPLDWFDHSRDHKIDASAPDDVIHARTVKSPPFGPIACLGAAAILSIVLERDRPTILEQDPQQFGPLEHLFPYLARRSSSGKDAGLPELPVPDAFKQTFRDWAENRVNFTSDLPDFELRHYRS
jgi:hypothetical protein